MAKRLLNAATAAWKVVGLSDLEGNSDDEETIESKDSVNGQSWPEKYDDASSTVKNQTKSAENKLPVSSGEKSVSEDCSEYDRADFMAGS